MVSLFIELKIKTANAHFGNEKLTAPLLQVLRTSNRKCAYLCDHHTNTPVNSFVYDY